jgi:ABC-2 type transport system permease protein
MRQSAVFIGKTAAELVRIATQIAIIIGLGVILGANVATGIAGAIGMTLIGMLFSLWFIALTNAVAVVTEDQESTIIASNFVQFPLLFLSSAFLPLSELPGWIQTIAQYNPVTYGVNAVRSLILGESSGSTWTIQSLGPTTEIVVPSVIVLSALVLALGLIAVTTLKRSRNNLTK